MKKRSEINASSTRYSNDNHNFRIRHGGITMIATFWRARFVWQGIIEQHSVKNFAKLICHKEKFSIFAFGEHFYKCLYFF